MHAAHHTPPTRPLSKRLLQPDASHLVSDRVGRMVAGSGCMSWTGQPAQQNRDQCTVHRDLGEMQMHMYDVLRLVVLIAPHLGSTRNL